MTFGRHWSGVQLSVKWSGDHGSLLENGGLLTLGWGCVAGPSKGVQVSLGLTHERGYSRV